MNETNNNHLSLSQLLRQRRQTLHLTQAQVAEQLKVEPESVGLWEHDRRRMELDRIPRLAGILKLNGKYLCQLALSEWHPRLYAELFGAVRPQPPRSSQPSTADPTVTPGPSNPARQPGTGPLESGIIVADRLSQGEQLA